MVSVRPFGTLPDGRRVEAITLANAGGLSATILTFGATLQAMLVPDAAGQMADVVLGHAELAPYLDQPQYFGSTVGRYANRIAGGRFRLDGREYQVPPNDGRNALHGGPQGFDQANWQTVDVGDAHVTLSHTSPDGDQGFPGRLDVTATYRLADDNSLSIDYEARCDAPTIVNITNHAYWNLSGEGSGSAMAHRLLIAADHYLPVDAGAIPTGEVRAVAGTAFDFCTPTPIEQRLRDAREAQLRLGRGYDHNWLLRPGSGCRLAARLEDPASGRWLAVHSDQPGLQFYSGNFLDSRSSGKSGRLYRMGDAVALEPQRFPDTPNQPAFGSARLDPGDVYRHRIRLAFGSRPPASPASASGPARS